MEKMKLAVGCAVVLSLFLPLAAFADPGVRMFNSSENCIAPVLSPDGINILYQKEDVSGYYQLYCYDYLAAGPEIQLTSGSYNHMQATWLAADVVVFTKYISPYLQLFTVDLATQTQTALTTDNANHSQPNPSPDGANLVFLKYDGTGFFQVYTMPATAGGTQTAVTTSLATKGSPRWSPQTSVAGSNYNMIAFIEYLAYSTQARKKLFTINVDGTGKTEVYNDAGRAETTETVTKGASEGADALTSTPVMHIVSVVQGATTYVKGTDYDQDDNDVDWLAGCDEPVTGTAYDVNYYYNTDGGLPAPYYGWNQLYPRWRPDSEALSWEQHDATTADWNAGLGVYPPGDLEIWVSEYSGATWQVPTVRTDATDYDDIRATGGTHTSCQNFSATWIETAAGYELVFEKEILGYSQIWQAVQTGAVSQTALTILGTDGDYQCTAPISMANIAPDTTAPTFAGIKTATHETWTNTAFVTWDAGSDVSPISYNLYYSSTQVDVFDPLNKQVSGVPSTETSYIFTSMVTLPQYFGVRCQDHPRPIFFNKVDDTGTSQIYYFSVTGQEDTNTVTIQSTPLPTPTATPEPPVPTQSGTGIALMILVMTISLIALLGRRRRTTI